VDFWHSIQGCILDNEIRETIMAWNEPGGNGNQKDPWGGGGNQGPPDLDEALRKLQEKLNGLFGGGGSGGSSGGGGGGIALSGSFIGVMLIILLVIWSLFGVYKIDEQERGVVLRFGRYLETVMPGLHWNPPLIDDVSKVNVTKVRSSSHRGLMLTEDENIVEVSLSVQYTVADPKDFLLEVRAPENSLVQATESALRHVVGSSEMHLVLTEGREQVAIEIQERLQSYIDNYKSGIQVTLVNIEDTQPPDAVQAAFDDVIKAKEDEERVKNEAESYKNGIIPEARGIAQRQFEEASAYKERVIAQSEGEASRFEQLLAEYEKAPEVTRQRLYLDTLQMVMANSSKVMIDVEGGNNLLYLPLDKMMQSSAMGASSVSTDTSTSVGINTRQVSDRLAEQLRRDNQSRRREVR
jgi:membrane protease subunit HflK